MAEQTFGLMLWMWLLIGPLLLVVLDNARTPARDTRYADIPAQR